MKYKDLGTMLSKDEMKTLKGGGRPGGGGGPVVCDSTWSCSNGVCIKPSQTSACYCYYNGVNSGLLCPQTGG